jgi:hypothetical protein
VERQRVFKALAAALGAEGDEIGVTALGLGANRAAVHNSFFDFDLTLVKRRRSKSARATGVVVVDWSSAAPVSPVT